MGENKYKRLFTNTVFLYLLTFSNYLMSFITVPYQTRVLGPDIYGVLGLTASLMIYFQLVIDFGFLLSATADVSKNRNDKNKISKIFSSVSSLKLVLTALSLAVLVVLCLCVDRWKEHFAFILLYFVSISINSFLPDYLYRGIEQMGAITVRTVLIKLFFTVMIFVVVKGPEDYLLIPTLQIIGNFVALVCSVIHVRVKYGIKLVKCTLRELVDCLKNSSTFFWSRIATTFYTAANTVVLDLLSGGGMTAYYTSADKLVSTAKSGLSPISDSLYPYMIQNRDFKLVKKMLWIFEPIIIVGCAVVFIWAEPLCTWFFGDEYVMSAYALRALLSIVIITLPTYICGYPVLGALGFNNHANYSVVVGSVFHIVVLCLLFFTGNLTMISLAVSTSATEAVILAYRVIVIFKNRNKWKSAE